MKIYISHAGNYDYRTELYKPLKESKLYKDHQIFLPHESQNTDVNLKDIIGEVDLIVAEVSRPSTGQGIELGRADSAHVPVVCFYKSGAKPSSSLRFVTEELFSYATAADLVSKLEEWLAGK